MIVLKKLSDETRVEFNSIFEVIAKAEIDAINNSIRIGDEYYSLETAEDAGKVPNAFEWQESVLAIVTAPPADPQRGDRVLIINPDAESEFEGQGNMIAERLANTWEYTEPTIGMAVYIDRENHIYFYTGNENGWQKQGFTIPAGFITPSMLSPGENLAGTMLILAYDAEAEQNVWTILAPGNNGEVLTIENDIPVWKVPQVGA